MSDAGGYSVLFDGNKSACVPKVPREKNGCTVILKGK
jgi:hypothetical protein